MKPALRAVAWLPHVAITVLMLVAMVDMLAGVFLRYVMTWVSATFDLPSIRFFWVEEIGEYSLAWLTFIAAAIGIRRGTHFAVHIVTERLSPRWRRAITAAHSVLLVAFGGLLAIYGWQVSELNSQSYSPALNLNLRWLYLSAVVGGVLMVVYSLAALAETLSADGGRSPGHLA
ncbi:MAG TPA: TRAP transporter small permease [Methylomirabilota bacterium]|nr:TRAP transporter small permease [Methylomirabilota bacterium]